MSNQTIFAISLAVLAIALALSYVAHRERRYRNTLLRVKRQHIEEILEAEGTAPVDYLRISSLFEEAKFDPAWDSYYLKNLAVAFLTKKMLTMNTADEVFILFDSYTKAVNPIVPNKVVLNFLKSVRTDVMDNTWPHLIRVLEKKFKQILDTGIDNKKEEFLNKFGCPAFYKYSNTIKSILSLTEQNYVAAE